jgi:hypothetical protein
LGKVVERYIPSSQQVTVVSGRGSSNKSRGGREHSTSRAAQEQGGLSAKALERAIAEGVAKEMDRLKKKLKPEPVTAAAQPPQPAVDMQDFVSKSFATECMNKMVDLAKSLAGPRSPTPPALPTASAAGALTPTQLNALVLAKDGKLQAQP